MRFHSCVLVVPRWAAAPCWLIVGGIEMARKFCCKSLDHFVLIRLHSGADKIA